MNCRQAQDHLFAGREATLPSDERAAFSTHLAECAVCRTVQRDLSETLTTWRAETNCARVPDAAMEWQKVRRRLHGAPSGHRRTSLLAWIAMPVAAAAAVAIGLYVAPSHRTASPTIAASQVASASASPTPTAATAPSTVVYVDDKSGWTFVLASDGGGNGQHI